MTQYLPGYEAGRTVTPREPLLSRDGMIAVPIVVDGQNAVDGANTGFTYEIRAGWLMGRITASGLWTPCKRTLVAGDTESSSATADATIFTVDNAAAFKVGDTVTVGSNNGLAITAVDYVTNEITVDQPIDVGDGEVVFAEDGSQTCRGVLLDFVKLRNADNTAAASKTAGLLIQGAVKVAVLLGDVAAIRADTAARLNGIRFSDEHGQ